MKRLIVLFLTVFLCSTSAYALTNGSFEGDGTGSLAGWDVSVPPPYPNDGNVIVTDALSGYSATDGDYFAVLSATSYIEQDFTWKMGDEISFDWAFINEDYLPFNDTVVFEIYESGVLFDAVTLADVAGTGNYQDTPWDNYTYTFDEVCDFTGSIRFGAINSGDQGLDSQLLVDNIIASNSVSEPSVMILFGSSLMLLAGLPRRRVIK